MANQPFETLEWINGEAAKDNLKVNDEQEWRT